MGISMMIEKAFSSQTMRQKEPISGGFWVAMQFEAPIFIGEALT